ncbi:potassium channel family protein [Nitritalea halalkaliphila]|nr:potassium channel family protein [Nitritalea halalkaliphila]
MRETVKRIKSFWLSDVSFVALLLLLLLFCFIIPIFLESGHLSEIGFNGLLVGLFLLSVLSASGAQMRTFALLLLVAHITLKIIRFSDGPLSFALVERIVGVANLLLFIFLNLRLLFRDQEANAYRIIGAVNVYLLLGMFGAFTLEILALTHGEVLQGEIIFQKSDLDFGIYIYYSMVSLSTVGYGDIVPSHISSKMLSSFLSTVGILYPAVVIAQLVSLNVTRKTTE